MFKSLIATFLLLAAVISAQDVTSDGTGVTEVKFTTGMENSRVCPKLVNHTYETMYHNDKIIQEDDGACLCIKHGDFQVDCGFAYCSDCFNDICVTRNDAYNYGSSYDPSNVQVKTFVREYFYYVDKIPFTVKNETGDIVSEGNWTSVKIESTSSFCKVMAVDDKDQETQKCTCESVFCPSTGVTQFAYDCDGNKWGNCDPADNTFDPHTLKSNDPLFALNTKHFSWRYCYETGSKLE
jgi:hypothetical protein